MICGATGTIGRHLVNQLVKAGQQVRALTRDPARAAMPDGVEVAAGDLTTPATLPQSLEDITAMHLISMGGDDYAALRHAPEIVEMAVAAGVRRVTVLTGTDAELAVHRSVANSELEWTHIRPLEFMANRLAWAPSVHGAGEVTAFGNARMALVHEGDVAEVIAAALTTDGHTGKTYVPTGPQAVTRAEAAEIIGQALGKPLTFRELTREEARQEMHEIGVAGNVAEFVLDYEASPPVEAGRVSPVVAQVLGRSPRSLAEWVKEHASSFEAME